MKFIVTPNYAINVDEIVMVFLDWQAHCDSIGAEWDAKSPEVAIWFKGNKDAQYFRGGDAENIRTFCLPIIVMNPKTMETYIGKKAME